MKKMFTLAVLSLLATAAFAQTIPVTFQVDLGAQVYRGLFTPGTDSICVRGSFQADAGDPGGNWQGYMFKMTDPDADTIYTVTANLPSTAVGTSYEFKFVKNNDGWEGTPNRSFTLAGSSMLLPKYWFNDDSSYVIQVLVTNTINFQADLSTLLGTGIGYFDPNTDSMLVMGLDWDGLGTVLSGIRKLSPDPFVPGQYTTSMTIKGPLGDSTKWKFKAYPDNRFTNTGWETGTDRWFKYVADGQTVTLDPIVPRIYPTIGPLANDVNVLFQVDMNHNPVNVRNGLPIPVNQIDFMGLKGGSVPIGNWQGNWVVADTTAGQMIVLNDSGLNGDLVAGDKVWSRRVLFPATTPAGAIEYKFAAHYPGADTVNGGSAPLDNEGGFGQNHIFILRDGGQITLRNNFGDFTTEIRENNNVVPDKFEVSQNYPNPFNPSTKITFTIPNDGFVTLKIYNVMGEEVATLLDSFQKAGGYDVEFNASKLTSGIYFYTLSTGNFSATKKMMLIK